ncbi:MAG: biotin--[acetyl-CoA-carboxylase] ligase [Desulfovibrionaceae bacterium]|nr:biotin--[acetyl-CoA-carboxylase] ligase [Desulfovibrionaceae bacterium]
MQIRILSHDPSGQADDLDPARAVACPAPWAGFFRDFGGGSGWEETVGPDGARYLVPCGQTAAARGQGPRMTVCGPCGSALDVAWSLIRAGDMDPWDVVVAVSQRGGRGQMRRAWESPPGNVYAAVAWPADSPAPESLLPVFVGYLLAEYLCEKGVAASFKWPNDLLAGGKKVGGTLLEERGGRVVAGVGINLTSAPDVEKLRPDHAFPAGALARFGRFPGPVPFTVDLVKFLQTCYHDCVTATCSFPPVARIEPRLAFLGREVLVREGGSDVYMARVLGLAGDGGLRLMRRVDGTNRECVIHSGGIAPPLT